MEAGNVSDENVAMLSSAKKSIAQAVFVISFDRDKTIRTKQFDIEKAMAPLAIGQTASTNLPDDFNPMAPRVTLNKGRLAVFFSQLAAQITIDIDNTNGKSTEVILDSIAKQINLFQNCVTQVIPQKYQREHGLIISVQYSVDLDKFSEEAVVAYVQSRFIQATSFGAPASASINVGYKTDDGFFLTLTVQHYKIASGEIPAMSAGELLDIKSLPITEGGVELKIDINSRPLVEQENQPDNVTDIVLKKSIAFIKNDADKLMGAMK